MRRDKFTPSLYSVICSDHFQEKWLDKTGQIWKLREDAEPTLFDFPDHLVKDVKLRKPPTARSQSTNEESDMRFPQYVTTFHNYAVQDSPRKLKRKIDLLSDHILSQEKKLKISQQKTRRMKKKIESLDNIVDDLKQKKVVSENCLTMLEKCYSGVPLEVTKRMLFNEKTGRLSRKSYPDIIKSFATTLQFYSSKAYQYVRKTFDLALPHPSVIRKWYSSVNASPGFSSEVIEALRQKSLTQPLICSLMIDEMSVKKHIEWNGEKMVGFVDLGFNNAEDDSSPVATEALVFMIVSLTHHWKVPVAFFFVSGLSGEERANMVKECLIKLYEASVTITSLTCDGPSCHFSMINYLGAS